MYRLSLLVLLGFVVAFSGAPRAMAQARLPGAITDSTWELVSLTPAGGSAEDTTGGGITMTFGSENAVSGSGGCNNYRASYTTTGSGSIEFGPVAATLRACPEPQGSREGRFFIALDAVTTYRLDGSRLILSADDGTELIFTAQAAAGGSATTAPLAAALLGVAGLALRRGAARSCCDVGKPERQ
jgi:heat shock protein HslJ